MEKKEPNANQRAAIAACTCIAIALLVIGVLVVAGNPPLGLGICIAGVLVMLAGRVAYWTITSDKN